MAGSQSIHTGMKEEGLNCREGYEKGLIIIHREGDDEGLIIGKEHGWGKVVESLHGCSYLLACSSVTGLVSQQTV